MCWKDLHSLAECSLASTGLLCKQWNSTLGIRHSQFAYTIGGSILWSAGVSRGGAERRFFFSLHGLPGEWNRRALHICIFFSLFLCCLEEPGKTQTRQTGSFHWQHPKKGKHANYCIDLCYHTKPL